MRLFKKKGYWIAANTGNVSSSPIRWRLYDKDGKHITTVEADPYCSGQYFFMQNMKHGRADSHPDRYHGLANACRAAEKHYRMYTDYNYTKWELN